MDQTHPDCIWSPAKAAGPGGVSLDDFLDEYEPFNIARDDDAEWLCVTRGWSPLTADQAILDERDAALRSGRGVLKHLGHRLAEVKTRAEASKLHTLGRANLESIAFKHLHTAGYVAFERKAGKQKGKGEIQADGWQVNSVWDQLVRSLIDEDGALHKTMAQLVAVSLSPDTAGADAKHVFRIYVRCVFYERAIRSVVECLMAEFGIAKFEVRSVLYDELGIGDEDEQPTLKKGFRFPAALWTENIVDEERQAELKAQHHELVRARKDGRLASKVGPSQRKTRSSDESSSDRARKRKGTPKSEDDASEPDELEPSPAKSGQKQTKKTKKQTAQVAAGGRSPSSSPAPTPRKTVKGTAGTVLTLAATAAAGTAAAAATPAKRIKGDRKSGRTVVVDELSDDSNDSNDGPTGGAGVGVAPDKAGPATQDVSWATGEGEDPLPSWAS